MRWARVTDLSDGQVDDLRRLYQDEWWTEGRERDEVETVLEETDVVVAFRDTASDELVAFARVSRIRSTRRSSST